MAEEKKKREFHRTPIGVLQYPYLTGEGRDFEGDNKFKYSTKMLFEGADADAFEAELEALKAEIMASARDQEGQLTFRGKKDVTYPFFERTEDGKLVVKFRIPATITPKTGKNAGKSFSNKPRFFDSKNQPITEDLNIGTGTRGRITFTVYAWRIKSGAASIRLEPRAIQVAEVVEYSGRPQSATDYGFEEMDGYEYEPSEIDAAVKSASDAAPVQAGEL
jgi:hypothetical protein